MTHTLLNNPHVVISTTDKELYEAFKSTNFTGIEKFEPLRKSFDAEKLYHMGVVLLTDAAIPLSINLFSNWLYDVFIKRGSPKTKIEGADMPQNALEVETIIKKFIEAEAKQKAYNKARNEQ